MPFKSKSLLSLLCLAVVAGPVSILAAQEEGGAPAAIPGIKPAVVADAMSEEEAIKKASMILVYNQLGPMITQMKAAGIELDKEQALEGARRVLSGEPLGITSQEVGPIMEPLREKFQAMQAQRQEEMTKRREEMMSQMKELAEKNKAEGEAYLAENAKKEGVQTLDNGVQYEVMVEGTGPKPKATDKIKINYHGMFIDGKVFDSTLESTRGEPVQPYVSPANAFVPGFNAAVQAMPVGSKWKISIPSDQAYKMGGRGMPPNKTLIFEVEMLEIVEESGQ